MPISNPQPAGVPSEVKLRFTRFTTAELADIAAGPPSSVVADAKKVLRLRRNLACYALEDVARAMQAVAEPSVIHGGRIRWGELSEARKQQWAERAEVVLEDEGLEQGRQPVEGRDGDNV